MFCSEHLPVKLVADQEDGRKQLPARYGQLTFSTWLLAWDQYALAAAMLRQMAIEVAITHKLTVAKVAQQAAPKRNENLAVVYDMLIRLVACLSGAHSLSGSSLFPGASGRTRAASLAKRSALTPLLANRTQMC